MDDTIKTALQILRAHPESTDAELVQHIAAELGDADLADRLLEFVPTAFGYVALDGLGIWFPGTF
jgi:hypothetical protein